MPTNRQRREAERRRLQRQLQRRREREAARMRFTLIASIVGTVVLIGIVVGVIIATSNDNRTPEGAGPGTPTVTSPTRSAPSTPAATYPCTWTKDGTAARTVTIPATTRPPKSGHVDVSVKTSLGTMTFTLDRAAAPCTVASFVSLVEQKYYDSTTCHRLVTSTIFVLQCGDPLGTGSGGPGYTIPDEATGAETYPAGTIAMARTPNPHSGGSQFFIVYKNSPNLARNLGAQQYTVFGTVTRGLGIVQKVAAAGSDNSHGSGDGKPTLPLDISTASVTK